MDSFSLLDGFMKFCSCDNCKNVCPSIIDSFKDWNIWDNDTLKCFKPLKDEHILFCCTLIVSGNLPYDNHVSITNKGRLYRKSSNGKNIGLVELEGDEIYFSNSYLQISKIFLYDGINNTRYNIYHKKEYDKLIKISQDNNFSTEEITELKEFFNYQGFLNQTPIGNSDSINVIKFREFIEIYKKYHFNSDKKIIKVKNKKLETKNKKLKDEDNLCLICITNEKNMAFIPCGHLCICEECSKKYKEDKCIICRKEFSISYKIYL